MYNVFFLLVIYVMDLGFRQKGFQAWLNRVNGVFIRAFRDAGSAEKFH